MGADIHLFAERLLPDQWAPLSDGAFACTRHYALFCALAGVRCTPSTTPHVVARGLPADVSPEIADRFYVAVMAPEAASRWGLGGTVTPSRAEALVAAGSSVWCPEGATTPMTPSTHGHVSHPDWHHASWLALHEAEDVLRELQKQEVEVPEFELLLGFCRATADRTGAAVRLVFWFDN